MSRALESLLASYQRLWIDSLKAKPQDDFGLGIDFPEQERTASRFQLLTQNGADIFAREHFADGHITGSALVVSADHGEVLLTLHAKLGKWLQLGGHSDGHPWPHEVAMREALEESGLSQLAFLGYESDLCNWLGSAVPSQLPLPFDIDVHLIPASRGEPAHYHYDIRYVIVAAPGQTPICSEESQDLRWFSLDDAAGLSEEASLIRQFNKLKFLDKIRTQP